MANALEIGEIRPLDRPARSAPPVPLPIDPSSAAPRSRGVVASAASALEERRLFILLPFFAIAGLIVSIELPAEPQPVVLAVCAVTIALALAFSMTSLLRLRVVTLLAAFWAGLCLLPVHGALFGTAMLTRPAYGTYQGRVDEIVSATPTEQRVILSDLTPQADGRSLPVRRARILIKGGPTLSPGDLIVGPMRFSAVPGPVYPGGFDTQFHAYFDGVGAYGNSTQPPQIVTTGDAWSPARIVDGLRRGIAQRIDAVLPQPSAGVARAIINGDQSAVSDETRDTMATAGIAHVLSVSGLHLTMVAGGVFWVLRLLLAGFEPVARRVSVKRLAALGGIASAVFYYGISGGNVAALRSTLMILLVFGAVLFGRRALTMRNVAIAGAIIIIGDPASVFRPSFQLSFAAVVALVGAYENFRSERLRDASLFAHAWAYGKGIVLTSLVAGLATLLFSVYHFQQTSPLGVLGNLLTLPLVGFIMMPAALVAVLLMPFGIEGPFLLAMGWSIDRMLDLAVLVAAWSEHLRAAPLLTPWALVIGLAALGWFAFFRDRWRLLGPALAVPLVLVFTLDHPPDVLIADTTLAMVVRGPTGLELADGKAKSFALEVWRNTYADPISNPAAQSCDSVACIGQSSAGFSYAIVVDPSGFADECGRADLVVARDIAPNYCASAAVIDSATLAAHGVQWLRWDDERKTFEIRPAIVSLNRPWRVLPR